MTNQQVINSVLDTMRIYLDIALYYRSVGNHKLEKEFMQMYNWSTYLIPKLVENENINVEMLPIMVE